MHWFLLGVASLAAAEPLEVSVHTLRGSATQGKLLELSERTVVLATPAGRQEFDAGGLASVQALSATRQPTAALADSELAVTLVDGSALAATQFAVQGKQARLGLAGSGTLEIQARALMHVRFRKPDAALERQWREILKAPPAADLLVLRRVAPPREGEADKPGSVGLDQLEGILFDVDDKTVAFEFDGTRVAVPRGKVEGLVYRRPPPGEAAAAVCRVADTFGSLWNAQSVRLTEAEIELVSVAGVAFRLPVKDLRAIDFSAGNLTFLGDLEPESVEWRPYVQSAASPPSLAKWFQPKWDGGIYGGPLMLGGESFERGLALHSRTRITFRLARDYRRLLATVGVDDRFRGAGNVRLVISSEQAILFERTVSGTDPPFDLDVDIHGVRRLQILVDFGEDRSDSGDHLNLCNARLTK